MRRRTIIDKELFHKLVIFLEENEVMRYCDGTLRLTEEFIDENGLDRESTIEWLQDHGGFCDCEVLLNIAYD